RHVGLDRDRAATDVDDLLDDGLGLLGAAAVVDRDGPALGRERLRDRGADARRAAGDEGRALGTAVALYRHVITPAPYVKPAPKAASSTVEPERSMPRSCASASASGSVAADVLPKWSMQSMTLAGSSSRRSPTAVRMRALAWW